MLLFLPSIPVRSELNFTFALDGLPWMYLFLARAWRASCGVNEVQLDFPEAGIRDRPVSPALQSSILPAQRLSRE